MGADFTQQSDGPRALQDAVREAAPTLAEPGEAPAPWDIQKCPRARTELTASCKAIRARLETADFETKRAFLCDTRAVHQELFGPYAPPSFAVYAGAYRGALDTPLEARAATVLYKDHPILRSHNPTVRPGRVAERMEALAGHIAESLENADAGALYFKRCVRAFAEFLLIHPYLDGNGHIARLVLAVMLDVGGIEARPTWTIHPRPYSDAIGLCIESFTAHPDLIEQYLRKWFRA